MRRKIISFLCVLCLAVTMCATVFAADGDTEKGNTKLSLTAALSADKAKIDVTISLTETTPIKGIQFDLAYEGEKVDPVETADVATNIFDSALTSFPKNVPDTCRYLGDNGTAITTTGRLVTFSFNVKAGVTGDIFFNVNSLKVADKDAKPVECSITPSEVTVTIEPDEPSSSEPEEPSSSEPEEPSSSEPEEPSSSEPESSSSSEPEEPSSSEPESSSSDSEISSSKPVDSNSSKPADSSKPDEAPSTGDNSNMLMYVIIAIVCLGAMTAVVVYRNKVHN